MWPCAHLHNKNDKVLTMVMQVHFVISLHIKEEAMKACISEMHGVFEGHKHTDTHSRTHPTCCQKGCS